MTTISVQPATRAADFTKSIGINTHLTATKTSYGNVAEISRELGYLGVNHVRDIVPGTANVAAYQTIGATGVKFDLIVMNDLTGGMKTLDTLAPYVGSVEGPNEVNITLVRYNGLIGNAAAIALQKDLYAAVHNDPLLNGSGHVTPVLNFSVALGGDYTRYGNLSAYADYTNVHAYGQYGVPPQWFLQPEIKGVTVTPGRPVIVTETGNYTMLDTQSGVTPMVSAKLMMDTLLDNYKNGVTSTYLYQLNDGVYDPKNTYSENHYGLFNTDGTPKAAATALHNLTSILADTGANAQTFAAVPLAYSVSGLPSSGSHFVMEKSNGAYDIALWQEPNIWNKTTRTENTYASTTVTLTLGKVYQTINVFDPMASSAPVKTYHDVSSIQVALNTSAMVVEVEPNPLGQVINTGAAGGVFASTMADTVIGGAGDATVNVSGTATVTGSTGALAVTLTGSSASVTGGAGALSVTSASGSNTVVGGPGAFSYTGGASSDRVTTGTSGSNQVTLTAGHATVTGSTGALAVTLAGSSASIVGGAGALSVTGTSGSNTVVGGSGAFSYTGGASNDQVTTGTAANQVTLGTGNDTVTVLAATTLVGGAGAATVTLNGTGSSVTGGSGALSVTDNGGNNTVIGGTGAFSYIDAAGDDRITTGTSSSNTVSLGAGSDTVTVLAATRLTAGSGTASVTLNSAGSTVTGGTGALSVTDTSRGPNTITGGAGVLSVKSALGGDTITTNNTSGVSSISLGTGSNTVTVNGTTYINADKSNLAVISNGNLSINGGSGALTLTGISGSAYVFTQGGTKNLLNLGSGANTVLSHGADTINASTVAGAASTGVFAASSATITGGAGTLVVNGQAAAITVTGGTGAVKASSMANGSLLKGGSLGGNILSASGGNTTLMGGGGGLLSDTGTAGGNLLMAGSGATTLTAGSGNDTLVGGSGADVFVLTRAAAAHGAVIQNYTAGSDTLSFVGFGSTPAIASQQVSGGNLNLTLADQTHVTLVGVTHL